jgi:RNA polymerase sigma factor (sigma-70 family)
MDGPDVLAERFEQHRGHLLAVAQRMLGSGAEADDAVQEAWLRLHRTGADDVDNLGGWLTTVVARVCLDMLRTRTARREEPIDEHVPEPVDGPEREALLADAVGPALLVVLDTLTPAERLAFVLHDLFAVPFDEIAAILQRSPTAARQLASRARRRVRGGEPAGDPARAREVVAAFLAASREGEFAALLAMLDPDVVLRADATAVRLGAAAEVRGAEAVAEQFAGRARVARAAVLDGAPGAVWMVGGRPRVAFSFEIDDGEIRGIELVADPARLTALDVVFAGG